ncbi:DNA recombination protein RmuC [Fodinicurvata fenggangensis]|uniref:DNA recombination protein RmuC n=1 Tax=Fodinicurvata fenggangensis TaxID=1121830 RepID=UPI000B0054BA|nr:DNA recombination protein RmuC [Fodinicurvata fenggangensis]
MDGVDPLLLALTGLVGLMVGVVVALLLRRGQDRGNQEVDQRLRQLSESQAAVQAQMSESLRAQERALARSMEERLSDFSKKIGDRLNESQTQQSKSLTDLRERLAVIDKAQQNITELSGQVVGLQDILSNKQARGAFGEVQLHDIVENVLPPSAYSFQASLSTGTRADCLLLLPNPPGSIAIDSKFPLEAFRNLRAAEDEASRTAAMRAFTNDVRKHIKDIRDKYIIAGETAESALMFLPSEAVYAELHANFTSLVEESYRARVWIVSPTTLMATLNTVRAVLKDVRMREQAGVIQTEVHHLLADVGRLDDRVGKLQRHFDQATEDIRQIRISTEKVSKRGERIEDLQLEDKEDSEAQITPPVRGEE